MVVLKTRATVTCERRAGDGRGFTLVELVVTLVIIGALAAVSAPIFFSKQSFEQHGFFNELLSAVRYAQKLAVATGCTVSVQIAANSYTLLRDANTLPSCNDGPFDTPVTEPTKPTNQFTQTAPSGISISAVPVTVFNFAPLGNSTADVTVTVNPGNRQFRVWAATGYVERL